jgi:hypothetical protein
MIEAEELTEERMVALRAARLLDEVGGFALLDEELRKKGFTLAAYITNHEMHLVTGEVYSECRLCMEALYPSERPRE